MTSLWVGLPSLGLLALMVAASPNKAPLERMGAGYTVGKDNRVAIRDALSGCYLIRSGD